MKNRRTIALLLAAVLAVSLLTVSADLTGTEAPEEGRISQDIIGGVQTPPAAEAPSDGLTPEKEPEPEVAAPEQETAQPEEKPAPDPEGTVSFANLAARVAQGNLNYLILEETIAGLEANDLEEMEEELRDGLELTASMVQMMKMMGDSVAAASMQSSYNAMRETFEDLRDGKLQKDIDDAVWQLRDAQNSIVMATEGIYAQMAELYATDASLGRSLAALDRQLQELDLRYDLGQVSALTLQQAKAGRTSLVSGRQTLQMGLDSGIMGLQYMIGGELTGGLKLTALPAVKEADLAAMDEEADLTAAMEASYKLYAAQKTLEDAEETYLEAKDDYYYDDYQFIQAQHTWQAAQYTYENERLNYEMSFRTLYDQVKDYKQVLDAARTSLAVEQSNYQVDQLKYEQGTISRNALLTAEDDLAAAKDTVATAERNLFVAYNNYRWAVDHGILN